MLRHASVNCIIISFSLTFGQRVCFYRADFCVDSTSADGQYCSLLWHTDGQVSNFHGALFCIHTCCGQRWKVIYQEAYPMPVHLKDAQTLEMLVSYKSTSTRCTDIGNACLI